MYDDDMSSEESTVESWFAGRLPAEWSAVGPPSIVTDRDEITVTISIDPPELPGGASDADRGQAPAEPGTPRGPGSRAGEAQRSAKHDG
jgi:hypothetical protein